MKNNYIIYIDNSDIVVKVFTMSIASIIQPPNYHRILSGSVLSEGGTEAFVVFTRSPNTLVYLEEILVNQAGLPPNTLWSSTKVQAGFSNGRPNAFSLSVSVFHSSSFSQFLQCVFSENKIGFIYLAKNFPTYFQGRFRGVSATYKQGNIVTSTEEGRQR